MGIFTSPSVASIAPIYVSPDSPKLQTAIQDPETATLKLPGDEGGAASFQSDEAVSLKSADLQDQFFVFQLSNKTDGSTILESTQIDPAIDGGDASPDVLINVEMVSFHLGAGEKVDQNTKATLRMNIGKDENSTDKKFDTVFWSIAAGLNLYDQAKKGPISSKDMKSDFQAALGHRPIEIAGGLGKITFEVVKHKEPPWWKKIFSFAESGTGSALISTLGFPALTSQAIRVIDELLDRLTDSGPEILFKGFPMKLAFSKYARNEFAGGNPLVRVGCINRGFVVFVRGRDFATVANSHSLYYPTYGRLVPADVGQADLLSGRYNDPLRAVTYAVFRIGTKETKLDPSFQYSA
jgi:hypothetical protein